MGEWLDVRAHWCVTTRVRDTPLCDGRGVPERLGVVGLLSRIGAVAELTSGVVRWKCIKAKRISLMPDQDFVVRVDGERIPPLRFDGLNVGRVGRLACGQLDVLVLVSEWDPPVPRNVT